MDPTAKRGSVPMSGKSTSRSKLVERALPNDETARQNIMAFAKERIAPHLGKGIRFCERQSLKPLSATAMYNPFAPGTDLSRAKGGHVWYCKSLSAECAASYNKAAVDWAFSAMLLACSLLTALFRI
jgi:hypothetical protein